jgi:hypothetical protein
MSNPLYRLPDDCPDDDPADVAGLDTPLFEPEEDTETDDND